MCENLNYLRLSLPPIGGIAQVVLLYIATGSHESKTKWKSDICLYFHPRLFFHQRECLGGHRQTATSISATDLPMLAQLLGGSDVHDRIVRAGRVTGQRSAHEREGDLCPPLRDRSPMHEHPKLCVPEPIHSRCL